MTGVIVLAAALLAVGTALGLLRRQRHRIRALEAEREQMYEAQRILQRAQERKDRRHLHLLIAVPLAWLAGRLSSSTARLATATAVATMATGASVMSPDISTHHTPGRTPPAGADQTVPTVDPDVPSYNYSPTPQSTTSSSVVDVPPAPATDPVAGTPTTTAPPSAVPSAPATTTTTPPITSTSSTTTTLVPTVGPVCVNPQGLPVPAEVCL